jgi:hypothetical protein
MPKNRWTLFVLVISGLSSIASLGLVVVPVNAATTSTTEASTKLQQFSLKEMTFEDISKIKNGVLRELLETTRLEKEEMIARMYDTHSSVHVKNSLRKRPPVTGLNNNTNVKDV